MGLAITPSETEDSGRGCEPGEITEPHPDGHPGGWPCPASQTKKNCPDSVASQPLFE